jgi:hypothetical protein
MRKKRTKVQSPRLKAYLESSKHDSILLGEVDRYLQLHPDPRDATVVHPSEMSKPDWCPRATWHRLVGHSPKEPPAINLRSNLIFAEGTESGRKWQQWTREMGILWGKWECQVCGEIKMSWSDELSVGCPAIAKRITTVRSGEPPRVKQWPRHHVWKYREVPLSQGLIGGHADGIVNPTGDESLVMENKTVGPGTLRMLDVLSEDEPDEEGHEKFSRITKILPSHFRQTQIYLRLAQSLEAEIGPIRRGLVIYEYKSDQQVREFPIVYDTRWTDPLWDTVEDIKWAIDKDREVKCPRGGCKNCKPYEEQ